jgi:hypothetical protein
MTGTTPGGVVTVARHEITDLCLAALGAAGAGRRVATGDGTGP